MWQPPELHAWTDLLKPWTGGYSWDDRWKVDRDLALRGAFLKHALYPAMEHDHGLAAEIISAVQEWSWAYWCILAWSVDEMAAPYPQLDGATFQTKPCPPYDYIRRTCEFLDAPDPMGGWLRTRVLMEKSRDVMASIIINHRLLRCAAIRPNSYLPIISKIEDDSKKQIARIQSFERHWPQCFRATLQAQKTISTTDKFFFRNGSRIEGLPQMGGQAFRGDVPTIAALDEAAWQSHFKENWSTVLQKMRGSGCQLIGFSSANPGQMSEKIHDREDGMTAGKREILWESPEIEPHTGRPAQSFWRNGRNKIDCISIFYFADPNRRPPEYIEQKKAGDSMDNVERDLFINWESRAGRRVFPQVCREVHYNERAGQVEILRVGGRWHLRREGEIDPDGRQITRPVRLMRLADYGRANPFAVLWIAIDDDLDWTVYRCYYEAGRDILTNAAAVDNLSGEEDYIIDVLDAANRLPEHEGQYIDLWRNYRAPDGRYPFRNCELPGKGRNSRQSGIEVIGTMLHATMAATDPEHPYWRTHGYSPAHVSSFLQHSLLMIAPGCRDLFDELTNARYDERSDGDPGLMQPETTIDAQDHAMDALRYGIRAAGAYDLIRHRRRAGSAEVPDAA